MSIFQSSIFDRYILLSNFFYRPIISPRYWNRRTDIEGKKIRKEEKKRETKKDVLLFESKTLTILESIFQKQSLRQDQFFDLMFTLMKNIRFARVFNYSRMDQHRNVIWNSMENEDVRSPRTSISWKASAYCRHMYLFSSLSL